MADEPIHPLRVCTKCDTALPLTRSFFSKDKKALNGFSRRCKPCDKVRYEANREKHVEWAARAYARNRSEKQEKNRAWREANADKMRGYRVERTILHRERDRAVQCEWERRNREKLRVKNRGWYRDNPELAACIRARRRARLLGAEGSYSKQDVADLLIEQSNLCYYCGTALQEYHIDHFVPLARGGSNDRGNIRISCPPCNFSKGAKLPWEWMPSRFQLTGITE